MQGEIKMRKKILMLFSLVFVCLFLLFINMNNVVAATITERPFNDSEYYSSVSGKSGDALLEGLASLSRTKHTTETSYGSLPDYFKTTDKDPNKSGSVLDFYSKISTTSFNREHVWPKSLSGNAYENNKAGADVHHIRPTISSINSSRNNSLYGELNDRDNYAKYSF